MTKRKTRSLQRRRDRHHHHHHGAGVAEGPHGADLEALRPLGPAFLSYVLSFIYLGIYWNNHHHLLHAGRQVDGRILWANLHLLFWLSLFPFVTHWTGETGFAAQPVATYGVVLLLAGFAYCAARAGADRARRRGLRAGDRDRERLQGQPLGRDLPGRDPAGLCEPLGLVRSVRGRGRSLARPGSAHRAGPRGEGGEVECPAPRVASAGCVGRWRDGWVLGAEVAGSRHGARRERATGRDGTRGTEAPREQRKA